MRNLISCTALLLATSVALSAQTPVNARIAVDWKTTEATSVSTPTYQVVVNPMLERGAQLHDGSFKAIADMGADYVRFVPWLPYPRLGVAELEPPGKDKTSWDFSRIDPLVEDLMAAQHGHSVMMNFSTMPAWLWKTAKPVPYPPDPDGETWSYTQGTEIKDPTYQQAAGYYVRLLSWYEKGGFTDERGVFHKSDHHYKFAYWELLNEIDSEHQWTAPEYAKFFDVVSTAMHKVDPGIKFVACASAFPAGDGEFYRYFLDPRHHAPGVHIDYMSYHFYATPPADEPFEAMQYTFFDQAEGFLHTARYIEQMKHQLSPGTKTDLNELGSILASDDASNQGGKGVGEPPLYWNLSGALYAYLYLECARMGIDVVGESQLVGYPSQYPSVSMINYVTAEPNARYWTLKLLHDHFGPGDRLVATSGSTSGIAIQAFVTTSGKKILLVNKRDTKVSAALPKDSHMQSVTFVAPSTGDKAPVTLNTIADTLTLEPFEVAVVNVE